MWPPRLALLVLAALGCGARGDDRGSTGSDTADATSSPATSAGPGTGDGSDTAAGSSSGAPLPGACTDVAECRLHGDCCTCEALAIDQSPATCDAMCERTMCEQWGITEILCSHTCLVRLVECDASLIDCADPPPTCAPGFAPSIENRCWTLHCVPVELCAPS